MDVLKMELLKQIMIYCRTQFEIHLQVRRKIFVIVWTRHAMLNILLHLYSKSCLNICQFPWKLIISYDFFLYVCIQAYHPCSSLSICWRWEYSFWTNNKSTACDIMQQLSHSVCYWNPKDVIVPFCGVPLPLSLVMHEFIGFPTTHMCFSHQFSCWKFCGRQK